MNWRLLSFQWLLIFVILLKAVEPLVDDHSHEDGEGEHDHSTSWTTVVAKKRLCPSETHEIVFRYSHEIDHHSRLLMINETKAESAEECAKICFENHCDFAQFDLKTSICAFSVNTDILDTHCKDKDKTDKRVDKVVLEKDDEGIEMNCIECRKRKQPVISESKDDNIKELIAEPKPSTTTIGYRQSCIVTFQVFMNEDINAFKTTRIATVSSINECAYICYQNSCSGAIYVPSDGEANKAQCKVQMREKEKCNSKLQRHYSFSHDKAVVLSCFRCQPDKPITLSPNAEIIRATTTPTPELTKGRLTTIAPEKEGEETPGKEGPVPPPVSSNKVEDIPKEAKPPAMAPTESGQVNPENNAAEEPETAKSVDTGKATDKPQAEKPASAEKEETSKSPVSEKPVAVTEKAKSSEKTDESSKPGSTTASAPDTSGKTVSLGKVTTGPVDFGGCLITFQADYLSARPSEFKSEFELNLNVESPEICATRCYQDGCTGALYLSNNGTCVLGYGDKHHCNKRPLINFLNLKDAKNGESIWIHCTSCRSGKYGATGSVTGNMNDNKVEMGEQLSDGKTFKAETTGAPEAATIKESEEKPTEASKTDATTDASKIDKSSEKTTEAEKPAVTEKPADESTKTPETEATTAASKEEKTSVASKATEKAPVSGAGIVAEEKPTSKPETQEKPTSKSESPEKSAEATSTTKTPEASSKQPADSEKPHKPEDIDGTQGCLITFQAGDLSKRPKEFTSEFELSLHTETPEICATRCYQDGCTGALFFPKNGTCVLGYGDKQYCDKSPILRFYKHSEKEEAHKESLWIHCTVCRSQRHGETFEPVAEEKLQSTSS